MHFENVAQPSSSLIRSGVVIDVLIGDRSGEQAGQGAVRFSVDRFLPRRARAERSAVGVSEPRHCQRLANACLSSAGNPSAIAS